MMTQYSSIQDDTQNIYVGIDVHKAQYKVQVLSQHSSGPSFSQPADPQVMVNYLKANFANAKIHCVYEAGFSGFALCRELRAEGYDCLVVHPADVPSTDKEKRTKTDAIDARKLSYQLRSQVLTGIYVPDESTEALRNLARSLRRLVRDRTRCKNRIKHFLMYMGIHIPKDLTGKGWSTAYMHWLEELSFSCDINRMTLDLHLTTLKFYNQQISKAERTLVEVCKRDHYREPIELLRSVPGIGLKTAITLFSEIGDMNRFKREDELFSYVGLVPHVHASGEHEYTGGLTVRGNKWLKHMIIESAWRAKRLDPALLMSFERYVHRMKPNKAIIRIAKKLMRRTRHVMRTKERYKIAVNKTNYS